MPPAAPAKQPLKPGSSSAASKPQPTASAWLLGLPNPWLGSTPATTPKPTTLNAVGATKSGSASTSKGGAAPAPSKVGTPGTSASAAAAKKVPPSPRPSTAKPPSPRPATRSYPAPAAKAGGVGGKAAAPPPRYASATASLGSSWGVAPSVSLYSTGGGGGSGSSVDRQYFELIARQFNDVGGGTNSTTGGGDEVSGSAGGDGSAPGGDAAAGGDGIGGDAGFIGDAGGVVNDNIPVSGSVDYSIDTAQLGPFIPPSFLGISLEWNDYALFYDRNISAWANIFAALGPSPIMRIGGASTEGVIQAMTSDFLASMVSLHCALGVRYIVGLPLFPNNPTLTLTLKAQFDDAFANFPTAIVNFELGNEPQYWPTLQPGGFAPGPINCSVGLNFQPASDENPYGAYGVCTAPTDMFVPGWAAYLSYSDRVARAITGCDNETLPSQWSTFAAPYWAVRRGPQRGLSGPAWGDPNIPPNELLKYVRNGAGCWLQEATVHFYPSPRANTIQALLLDNTTMAGVNSVAALVNATRNLGIPLRVSEAQSVSGGGLPRVSNVAGAALWSAQVAFEMAKAGAAGLHYHWGNGGLPFARGVAPAYIGVERGFWAPPNGVFPIVRAPWYGYLLYSRATGLNGAGLFAATTPGNGTDFNTNCGLGVKVYAVVLPASGQMSVTMLNKDGEFGCQVQLTVNNAQYFGNGTLERLLPGDGAFPLTNVAVDMSYAGMTYSRDYLNGTLIGTPAFETIVPSVSGVDSLLYSVNLPPASAALMSLRMTQLGEDDGSGGAGAGSNAGGSNAGGSNAGGSSAGASINAGGSSNAAVRNIGVSSVNVGGTRTSSSSSSGNVGLGLQGSNNRGTSLFGLPSLSDLLGGSSNLGGLGSSNLGGLGSSNLGGLGSSNLGGLGSSNLGGLGSSNLGGLGSSNLGGLGSSNIGGLGSSNVGGLGSSNIGGLGSSNIGSTTTIGGLGSSSSNIGGLGSTSLGGLGSGIGGLFNLGGLFGGLFGGSTTGTTGTIIVGGTTTTTTTTTSGSESTASEPQWNGIDTNPATAFRFYQPRTVPAACAAVNVGAPSPPLPSFPATNFQGAGGTDTGYLGRASTLAGGGYTDPLSSLGGSTLLGMGRRLRAAAAALGARW